MSRKVALITGVTGQDGSYLAEFLLAKGYEVHGLIRRSSTFNTSRIDHIFQDPHEKNARLFLHYGDLIDGVGLTNLIREIKPTEVYNLGGGKQNSCSILEAFQIAESFTGKKQAFTYVDQNRIGDHICYYSDLTKMRQHYPGWDITISLEDTIQQIVEAWKVRSGELVEAKG